MYANFKQYKPIDIFRTCIPAEDTSDDRFEECNHKTGCVFLDLFVTHLTKYGLKSGRFHASLLGITQTELFFTVQTLTGLSYTDFIHGYLELMVRELIKKPEYDLKKISKRLGYHSYSGFYRFVSRNMKEKPSWLM